MLMDMQQLDELRTSLYHAVICASGDLTHQSVILQSQALDKAINEAMQAQRHDRCISHSTARSCSSL